MRLVSFSIGVLAALCGTSIALANTAFNLGAAGNFGAITGFGSFTTNNGGINGLVGIESGGFFSSSGPGTISGVEFQDAVVDGGTRMALPSAVREASVDRTTPLTIRILPEG